MRLIRAVPGSEPEVVELDDADALAARQAEGFVVAFVPDPVVAGALPGFLDRMGADAPVVPSRGELAALEEAFGQRLPPELSAFVTWREVRALRYPAIGEWRVWGEEIAPPSPAAGNRMEAAALSDQQNYLGTAMLELAVGLVWLGSLGNGDAWFAHLDHRHPDNTAVLWFDHEERWLTKTAADSVGSLAWANLLLARLAGDDDDEPVPEDQLRADTARLQGRFSPTWHFSRLVKATGLELTCADPSPAMFYQARAAWIVTLLRGSRRGLRDVVELFALVDHSTSRFEAALAGPHLSTNPITAFYWCWRLWFFGKDQDLARCLAACAGSKSGFVRDIAALVAGFQAGRTTLGAVDLVAARAAFQALDLDPDRAEDRAREAAERQADADRAEARDREAAAALTAEADADGLVAAAWAHLGNRTVLDPLLTRLAVLAPELAADVDRLRWVEARGHDRGGSSYGHEREDVLEALSHGDPRLAPWLLSSDRDLWPVAAAVAAGDPRLIPLLEGRLALGAEWLHDATAAIRALSAAGPGALPALERAAAGIPWGDDLTTQLRAKHALRAVADGLGQLRGGFDALATLAGTGATELVPRALVALGRLGDPRALPLALPHLDGDHRDAALFALARLPTPEALRALDATVAALRGAAERTVVARLMREHARSLAGLPVDLDVARFALDVTHAQPRAAAELHETAAGLLARHAPREEAVSTLRSLLDDEHRAVRDAALAGLAALGVPVTPVWCDRGWLAAHLAATGPAALGALAAHPDAVLRWHAVRLAADLGAASVLGPALSAIVASATRCTRATRGYASDHSPRLRGLLGAVGDLRTTEADALLGELAGHPNPFVRGCEIFRLGPARERIVASAVREPAPPVGAPRVTVRHAPMGASPWLHGVAIKGLASHPDGRVLVASDGASGVVDRDGRARPYPGPLASRRGFDVAVAPDGRLAALAAHGGHLCLFDPDDGRIVRELRGHRGVPNFVARVAFSPSGRWLASVSNDHSLRVWEVATGDAVATVDGGCDLNAVAWLDDERVVMGGDRVVAVVDRTGVERARATLAAAEVAVHPDGRIFVGGPKEIAIVDADLTPVGTLAQARCLRLRFVTGSVFALSYEGTDRGLWRWDLRSGRRRRWSGVDDDGALRALEVDAEGQPLVGGADPRVHRWDARGKLRPSEALFHAGEVEAVRHSGGAVWTAGARAALRWGPAGAAQALVTPTTARTTGVAHHGACIAVATSDGGHGFDAATGAHRWSVPLDRCEGVLATPDGFCFGSGRNLVFVDPDGMVLATVPALGASWMDTLLPLPDGRLLVSGYRSPVLQVWDPLRRAPVAQWKLPDRGRADSYGLAVGAGRLWISRWNETVESAPLPTGDAPPTWDLVIALPGSWAPVAPSPDGRWLLAGDLIVDVATGFVAGRLGLPSVPSAADWQDDGLVVGTTAGAVFRVECVPSGSATARP